MRKSLQFVFYVLLLAGFEANAASIEDICARGDSDAFMEICAREEQAAKTRVDIMAVSDRVFNYCARIADGSYSHIESCILKEQQAKARLGNPDT